MDTTELIEKVESIKMPYRILIVVGTIALFAGLFIWLVYIPKNVEIAKVKADTENLQQQVRVAERKVKKYDKWKADKEKIEAEYQKALTLLPKTKEIPSLLRKITELGSEANLEFHSFSPSGESPQDLFVEIPVSISISGMFHDVLIFFDKVGRMKRIVNILNVSINPSNPYTGVSVTCLAKTYRFKDEKE